MEQEVQREASTSVSSARFPHLPNELVNRILKLAAYDPKTAHVLAYVSRAVCALTAADRWRVVAITTIDQFLCFWRALAIANGDPLLVLHAVCTVAATREPAPFLGPTPSSEIIWPKINQVITDVISQHDAAPPLSLPGSTPGQYTRHIFFEFDADASPTFGGGDSAILSPFFSLPVVIARHAHTHDPAKYPFLGDEDAPLQSVIPSTSSDLWTQFSQVDHLSLGPPFHKHENASNPYSPLALMGHTAPVELTLVYDGPHRFDEYDEWVPVSCRSYLRKVHFVGVDASLSVSGIEIPVDLLHELREGSLSTRGFLRRHASLEEADPQTTADPDHRPLSTGVTHIRYDTRAFALRPASIVAGRLAPFLREVYVVGHGTASAPPTSLWSDLSEEAKLLRSWGYGSFERLHLVWAAPLGQNPHPRGRHELLTGGWPREAHDVWTDSSQRGYASEDVVHDSFASELQDAMWTKFGWQGPLGNNTRVRDGLHYDFLSVDRDDSRRQSLLRVMDDEGASVLQKGCLQIALERQMPESRAKLEYGVRAPSTLLKLGGTTGAFTKQQRYSLFWDRAMGGKGAW